MKTQRSTYIKNLLIPCFLLSAVTGSLTGCVIFLFKLVSSHVISLSNTIYGYVREHPQYLPLLLLGALILGLLASLILHYAKDCRGGGIPTAVASVRGLLPLKWIQGLFALFGSAMLTYLGGVPLGNEGPSVQMGTSLGKATTELMAKKNKAWERYIMTGGACAGFATATGAPLTGILFAVEEIHRRLTPTIFIAASVSVLTSISVQRSLSQLFHVDVSFFDFSIEEVLPLKYLWVPAVIGIFCGLCAILFTKAYRYIRNFSIKLAKKCPYFLKISTIFVIVALLGFLCEDFIGSGHSLIDKIIEKEVTWYVLLAALFIRALLMISANNEGISGGVFIPILTFGAIIGALMGKILVSTGLVNETYYSLLVAVGMSSFLAVASRTPLTALTFSAEALCGIANILPIGVGVIIGYLIIEASGIVSFNDTIIEAKTETANHGKKRIVIDTHMTVIRGSFAVGKEVRDILWPPTCTVLSIEKNNSVVVPNAQGLSDGDKLHIHYSTYDPPKTLEMLEYILGKQEQDPKEKTHTVLESHIVPD